MLKVRCMQGVLNFAPGTGKGGVAVACRTRKAERRAC